LFEDGKIYALPGDVKYWVMWLNKNDLDKVGLPVPPMDWTWDDFKEYSRKLTWGEGIDKHYGSISVNWMHPNGLIAFNKYKDNPFLTAEGQSNFMHPVIRESLQLRYDLDMVEKTQFPLSEIVAMGLDYRSIFLSGKASMMPMATNIIPQIGQTKQFPHDFVTTFAPVPRAKDGNLGWTYHDNRFYSVGKTSGNPQEAYNYLRWFTTKGLPMKNVGTTAEKVYSTPIQEIIKGMTAEGPHLFDLEALTRVMTWPNLYLNHWYNVPFYTQELETIFAVEGNKAVMGEQSIDAAMRNMHTQAEAVIARNKK
jgi:multiple sugar transport system substrate-binding protein